MSGDAVDTEDGEATALEPSADRSIELPIEPGTPTPENVVFTLLGVLIALAIVFRLVQLYG